jgi:hypothetical protein
VPGGVAKTFIQTKEPELKGVFDEWLARIVCYAFSVSHQAFVNQTNRSTGETQKEMAEEEGLWPVLKWVKRLIDGVLIEDFGEEDIEFAWGEDAQIDAGQQAQVLTSYVGAGILTRNEARVKLGEAPVTDPAANVLTVTGPAPTPVGQGSAELAKDYNPEQPRDWRGRFGEGGGEAKSSGVKVASDDAGAAMFLGAAAAAAGVAAAGEAVRQWWNSSNHSSKPGDQTPSPPAQAEQPAAAASPAIPPDDQGDNEERPKKRFTVPDREPSIDNPEDYKLGWDPAKEDFVAGEVKTAWRLQEILQQPLDRSAIGGDFIGPDGRVYDAMGPVPDEHFNMKDFVASIKTHLRKSEMTTVIDLTGMNSYNIERIDDYVSSLPSEARSKIIKIGF